MWEQKFVIFFKSFMSMYLVPTTICSFGICLFFGVFFFFFSSVKKQAKRGSVRDSLQLSHIVLFRLGGSPATVIGSTHGCIFGIFTIFKN